MQSIQFDRVLKVPKRSFFLLGPRATGKSTWLKHFFPTAFRIDLLNTSEYFKFSSQPSYLREVILGRNQKQWVVIDEIQRIPALLNEVHSLIESHGYHFALTGSSARKLKRGNANLLAGRAIMKNFFPLVYPEWRDYCSLSEVLQWGTLPGVLDSDVSDRVELLETYTGTYLREEIKEETIVRNVESFARFFQVASLTHGQVTNLSSIARDASVPRASITVYYEILVDTLVGAYLPAWKPKKRIKEVGHPKFYFFDIGVVRSLQGKLRDALSEVEMGLFLETYLWHELRAYSSYQNKGGDLFYWRTPQQLEVDFIWNRGPHSVAIEVKSSIRWKDSFEAGLKALGLKNSWGVYRGSQILKRPWGWVLPVEEFLKRLWSDQILP